MVQVRRSARIAARSQKRPKKKTGKKMKSAEREATGSFWMEVILDEKTKRNPRKRTNSVAKSGPSVKASNQQQQPEQQSRRQSTRASYTLENIPEEVTVTTPPPCSPTDKDSCDELFAEVNLNNFNIPVDHALFSQHLQYLKSKQPVQPTQTICPQILNSSALV